MGSLHLVHLAADVIGRIHEVLLPDGGERAHNDQLQKPVGEGAENDKVVEASLDLAHLGGPPVRHPVEEPKSVAEERDGQEEHQLEFVVLEWQNL